ncbi:hypothetical protein K3495_g5152 [Podosphaera aphanis]|nr:hypothetical protein K3495_g5152 [Podosphaera aphanis]
MESLLEIQTRHRKEQKDLQARVTQEKKGATKKTRKGVNLKCEELERQLRERQEREREILEGAVVQSEEISSVTHHSTQDESEKNILTSKGGLPQILQSSSLSEAADPRERAPKKRNRQKERLARREAEKQAAIDEAKQEALNQPDKRTIERTKILDQINARGLAEKSIRPDGHCLFSAIADQLSQLGIPLSAEEDGLDKNQGYMVVRKAAATYIEKHPDDFVAWLEEPLAQYVQKIRGTAEWGGHLELLALARTYNVVISVLQDGAPQIIEPLTDAKTHPQEISLAYYRHGFGLGEHYNSLHKAS